jgi:hypothetical protein
MHECSHRGPVSLVSGNFAASIIFEINSVVRAILAWSSFFMRPLDGKGSYCGRGDCTATC